MMSLQILEALEAHLDGRRIHECFDLMVGVSTGAIITMLIGAFQLPVTECRRIYR
jgi:patatin-like phospholipase/acyl hydrolase